MKDKFLKKQNEILAETYKVSKDNIEKCLKCEELEALQKLSKENLCKALIDSYRPTNYTFNRHIQP